MACCDDTVLALGFGERSLDYKSAPGSYTKVTYRNPAFHWIMNLPTLASLGEPLCPKSCWMFSS